MSRIGNREVGPFPLFLAPMEDITDSSFRSICKLFGADVLISEFISAEGLIRDAEKSRIKIEFEEMERPFGIQIFGNNTDSMKQAAQVAERANPDFIDLNFGCPVRKIVMKGGGAALLQDIPKMVQMTEAVVKTTRLPVTVKTRLGWDEAHKDIVDIAERLQDAGVSAIGIHGRTRSQLYGGAADWTLIGAVKNNPRMKIPIWGNGDVDSGIKAEKMKRQYGIDGIMIGRAAMGNPWIFREIRHWLDCHETLSPPTVGERIAVLKNHIRKSIRIKGERIALLELRRLYAGYFKGVPDFKKIRMQLVTADTFGEIDQVLADISN